MGNLTAKTSGEIASFMTPAKTNIKSLKVHFSPKQLGTGDPSPENVREIVGWNGVEINSTGRNLLQNANGKISPLKLKKGTIITASSDEGGYFRGKKNGEWVTSIVWLNKTAKNGRKYTEPYTLPEDIDEGSIFLAIGVSKAQITLDGSIDYKPYQSNTISYQWKKLPDEYQEVEYIESTGFSWIQTSISIKKNDIVSSELIFQNTSSYTNNVWFAGDGIQKDGFQHEYGFYGNYGYLDNGIIAKYEYGESKYFSKTKAYFLNRIYNSDVTLTWRVGGRNGFNDLEITNCPPCKIWHNTFTINSNKVLDLIPCYRKSDNEIGMYDTVSQTFYTNQGTGEFLKGEDVNKTFYGGYVDLISGELVETNVRDVLDAVNKEQLSTQYNTSQTVFFRCDTDYTFETKRDTVTGISDFYCESLKPIGSNWGSGDSQDSKVNTVTQRYNSTKAVCMRMYNSVFDINADDTVEVKKQKINTWLADNPIVISYKLAEPITHQLTPTQLKSFVGQNNFWSNADYVEIEYDLIETEDIQKCRKKIMLNQPHIESVIGDVANFTTNMKAPLKECKIYFSPIQEGSGDPSPDNIRNIVGWDGVEVNGSGKNLIPLQTDESYWSIKGFVNTNGSITLNSVYRACDYQKAVPNKKYILTSDSSMWLGICFYDEAYNKIVFNQTNNTIVTLESPQNTKYYRIYATYRNGALFQLEISSDATSYEPYQGTTVSINWSDSVGTVYGGYVDLVKGEVVAEWYKLIFDGINNKMNRDYTDDTYIRCNQVYFSPRGIFGSSILCNNLPLFIQTAVTKTPCFWSANNGDKFGGIVLGTKEEYPDLAEATAQQRIDYINNWLEENPTTIVYKLKTPIHYSLTPQQLLTFKGENNIWSDTNGQTEVKFWTH